MISDHKYHIDPGNLFSIQYSMLKHPKTKLQTSKNPSSRQVKILAPDK